MDFDSDQPTQHAHTPTCCAILGPRHSTAHAVNRVTMLASGCNFSPRMLQLTHPFFFMLSEAENSHAPRGVRPRLLPGVVEATART